MIMTSFRLGAPVSIWGITCEQEMTLRGNGFVFLHILAHPEGNQQSLSPYSSLDSYDMEY